MERRRQWRVEDKLRIVAEAEAPEAVFAQVARRYDLSRGLLWIWRQQARRGELRPPELVTEFVPVSVIPELQSVISSERSGVCTTSVPQTAEIVSPDGTRLRVDTEISPPTLRRLLEVLRG